MATNSTGLVVSEPRSRAALGASSGTGTPRAGRPACSSSITARSHASSAIAARSPPLRLFGDALDAPLGLLEVGQHQLGLDRLDVGQRVDAALGVDHVLIAMGAHDVDDRVGLADVGQEAVAEALALVRSGHQPGDVVEVDRVPDDLRGAHGRGDLLHALVAHRHDRHVRLDRREGVVGGLGARFGERVEERGLARVGHPHDADSRAHERPSAQAGSEVSVAAIAVPSNAPASTSEG